MELKRVFTRGRWKVRAKEGGVMMQGRGWSDLRKGPQAKECRQPLEAENSNEIDLPLKPLE